MIPVLRKGERVRFAVARQDGAGRDPAGKPIAAGWYVIAVKSNGDIQPCVGPYPSEAEATGNVKRFAKRYGRPA